jgi:hypothetical protein
MTHVPICFSCKHFIGGVKDSLKMICHAFPVDIPDEILFGKSNHKKSLKEQGNKIVFERDPNVK